VLNNVGPAGSIIPAPPTWRVGAASAQPRKIHRPRRTIVQRTPVKRDVVAADHSSDRGSTVPFGGIETEFRGLRPGLGLRDYHGRKLVGHTGGVAGFVSRVMLVPEEILVSSC